jgi:hypothetical protein
MSDRKSSFEQSLLAEKIHTKAISLIAPRTPKRYTAAELNALCNLKAPMPSCLQSWEGMADIGDEMLNEHAVIWMLK